MSSKKNSTAKQTKPHKKNKDLHKICTTDDPEDEMGQLLKTECNVEHTNEPGKECMHEEKNINDKFYQYIGSISHAPSYLQDHYIKRGYRINFNTTRSTFKTLFMIHNELVNIWTHLAGSLFVIFLVVYMAMFMQHKLPLQDSVSDNINKMVGPLYEEFKVFQETFDYGVHESVNFVKHELTFINEKFNNFIHELDHIKKDLSSENIMKFAAKIEEAPQFFRQVLSEQAPPILKHYSEVITNKCEEVKTAWLTKIDSHDFDWIELYYDLSHESHTVIKNLPNNSLHRVSRWPIFVFLISAVLCLSFSATFHLFYTKSLKSSKVFLKLDYAGISLLISGSTFPPFVYGFYCHPKYYILYLSLIGTACLSVFFVSLSDWIHTVKYRKVKSIMYGALGIFAGFPIFHLFFLELLRESKSDYISFIPSLPFYIGMGAFYLGGLTIYSVRCPERWKPGTFDYWGHSHQLWHVCILVAIVLSYIAGIENFYSRKNTICLA